MKDAEEKEVRIEREKDSFGPSNPFPSQAPSRVLGRRYLVSTLSWQVGMGLNSNLSFPGLLLAVPAISEYLQAFNWMRAGVDLEVRINTSPFHYGAFMISHMPNQTGSSHMNSIAQCSGNKAIIVSAATQDAVKVHLPWVNPFLYFPLASGTSEIALVNFREVAPLTAISSEVTDTVYIQVYAAFSDIDLAGYLPINAPPKIHIPLGKRNEAQASKPEKFNQANFPAVIEDANTGEKLDIVNYNKDGSIKEAEQKAKNDEVAEQGTAKQALAYFGPIGNIVNGALMFGKGIAGLFALDKPRTVQHPMFTVVNSVIPGMAKGEGIDMCESLSLLQNDTTNNMSVAMGNESEVVSLLWVAMHPMIFTVKIFDGITDTLSFPVTPFQYSGTSQLDYLGAVSNLFQRWRGPIKFLFQFFTSPFISARFKIHLLYSTTIPDPENTGDVITQIVDVKGDTEYAFEVPFLWYTMWRDFADGINLPVIYVEPIIAPVGPAISSSPTIYLVVWRAAGDSFQWQRLVEPIVTETAVNEAQCDVVSKFKSKFPPLVVGTHDNVESKMCNPEHIVAFNQIWKRYERSTDLTFAPSLVDAWTGHISYCTNFFKYWHGGRRAVFLETNASNGLSGLPNGLNVFTSNPSNGLATFQNYTVQANCKVEVPYYNNIPFLPCDPSSTPTTQPELPIYPDTNSTLSLGVWSGADDFSFGYLCSPLVVPPPSIVRQKDTISTGEGKRVPANMNKV
jgi:hypothetical protein